MAPTAQNRHRGSFSQACWSFRHIWVSEDGHWVVPGSLAKASVFLSDLACKAVARKVSLQHFWIGKLWGGSDNLALSPVTSLLYLPLPAKFPLPPTCLSTGSVTVTCFECTSHRVFLVTMWWNLHIYMGVIRNPPGGSAGGQLPLGRVFSRFPC